MPETAHHQRLVPDGLIVERTSVDGDGISIVTRSSSTASACPLCGRLSRRVHSRYRCDLADLPAHGARVRVEVLARRFRCTEPHWRRRILAERFDVSIALPSGRRTTRLQRSSITSASRWAGARRRATRFLIAGVFTGLDHGQRITACT